MPTASSFLFPLLILNQNIGRFEAAGVQLLYIHTPSMADAAWLSALALRVRHSHFAQAGVSASLELMFSGTLSRRGFNMISIIIKETDKRRTDICTHVLSGYLKMGNKVSVGLKI